jgi:TonB family protein
VLFRLPASKGERLVGYERAHFRIDGRTISEGVTLWPGEKDGLLLITGAADEGERSARLAEMRELSLDGPRLKARLGLPGMPKVAEMLGRCNRGLLKLWGFAEAEQDRLASWPELAMPIGRVIGWEDYPVEAIRGGQQGEVRVRLMVDAAGRASGCALRYSSGWPTLDTATCKLLTSRARYRPAVDKAGQPMAAPAFHSVRWRIPG